MYSRLRALRYTIAFTGPILAVIGLLSHGLWCWALPLYAFVLIPLDRRFSLVLRAENVTDETVVTRKQGASIDLGAPRTLWAGLRISIAN